MPLKTTRNGQSFEGVNPSSTATTRLPLGLSYEKIIVPYGGTTFTPANMSEIRIVANGEVIRRYADATKLDTINQFDKIGSASTGKLLVLPFVRHGLKTKGARDLTILGTGLGVSEQNPNPITTLSLEIDIKSSAVAPTLGAPILHQTAPMPTGAIIKTRQYFYSPQGAGNFDISDIPKGELFNRVFFFGSNIDGITILRDNFTVFERTKAVNERFQTDGVRAPQSGLVVFDPTEEGLGAEGLVTKGVQDLRFRLNMSGAEDIEVVVETISVLTV